MTRFPKLAGLAEIAGLAGVSRTRAGQLAAHPDFPQPVQRLAMGPVWREADVTKFLATERKPGRRPKYKAADPMACSDPPEESCSDAGCPAHGDGERWDREP